MLAVRCRVIAVVICAAGIGALSGCGEHGQRPKPSIPTLTLYSSLPQTGPARQQALDVIDAEQLALQQVNYAVGRFKIRLISLNDGSVTTGRWNPVTVTANARRAAADPAAVAYIGELTPGSSNGSIRILNKAGILQVSPGDTAQDPAQTPFLEADGPTFMRFVPSDSSEAGAQLQVMKGLGVKRVVVIADRSGYGRGIARSVVAQAASFGIKPVAAGNINPTAYGALTNRIRASKAGAMFFGGLASSIVVELWDRVAAVSPQIKLFGPSGLDNDSFAAAIDPAAQQETFLSEPSASQGHLPPAGQQFVAAFQAAYHRPPQAAAFFGYAAVQGVLDAIYLAGSHGQSRALVARKYFALSDVASALGSYSVTSDGTATIAPYFSFSTVKNGQRIFDTLVVAATSGANPPNVPVRERQAMGSSRLQP